MHNVKAVQNKSLSQFTQVVTAGMVVLSAFVGVETRAADAPAQPATAPAPQVSAKPGTERNFYDVMEDLMADFEYDLKTGEVKGLRDLAIRNIATSENIPPSFRNHLELVTTERIMKHSKTKVIQCLPCRSKKATLSGDQMLISSPETNPQELNRIAKMSGIANFLDIAFSYQANAMLISYYISEPDSNSIIWSRTYNSETSRAAAFRRGVDFSQMETARRSSEYVPTLQYRAGIHIMMEPNLTQRTTALAGVFRMMERYDNRRKEVGFELNYIKDVTTISNTSAVTTSNVWTGINATLLFTHTWNFIDTEENFNLARGALTAAAGGSYAGGFLGGLVRVGWEFRLAKHWAVSAALGYRPEASVFLMGTEAGVIKGLEYSFGINYLF
jgi:hypothetical protein